ncbi:MAG: cytoskeletal protein RodZ [Syntrophorhabdaceae bacterium PtaU1.Bin034]|nr:MAG: cytoskeletal protein RodZ [Syntrophorhabdaceae bacterium PtaU1.Bin034]
MPFDLNKIGELLKASREEKGLSIEEVSETLFIRKSIIKAIESGKWDLLPHPVYVKGYIVQYASLLDVSQQVQSELIAEDAFLEEQRQKTITKQKEAVRRRWEPQKKIIGAATMAGIVIAFLVFQNMERPTHVAPSPRRPAAQLPAAQNNYQTVAKSSYDSKEGDKLVLEAKKLVIACQDRTWVRIVIDGSEKKEFTLNPEEVVMLNAKETFDLLIGNAGGVKLFYNGKDTGFTGNNGEVKRINLS